MKIPTCVLKNELFVFYCTAMILVTLAGFRLMTEFFWIL